MDRGAWQATVHGVSKESDMTERLNNKQYKVYVMLNTHIVYLIQKAIKYSFSLYLRSFEYDLQFSLVLLTIPASAASFC